MAHSNHEYDSDFYSWAINTAELIRQRKFTEIDIANLAEEIESMGRNSKRELTSWLAVLITHLLKWQFQPSRRSTSWKLTIKAQRISLLRLLKESPSLKHEIELTLADAYEEAIVLAANETGLSESAFPEHCSFNLAQCLDQQFFPNHES